MPFFKSNRKTLTKLKTFKNDLAPMGFYFDIFSTKIFQIPILPIPMRIDKISNGEPTLLITPNREKLEKAFKKLKLRINFNLFYFIGIKNFLNYASIIQKDLTLRGLDGDKIIKWWKASNNISAFNPDLSESFTFITSQFLKTFSYIDKNNLDPTQDKNEYKNILIDYCDSIIKYFRNKIEKNVFSIENEDIIEMEKLYLEKKQKYYPLEIKILVNDLTAKKSHEMRFVPYLIYDDLLDSFYYNKKLLENTTDDAINLKVYEDNDIIIKTSNIDDIRTNSFKIELENINLIMKFKKIEFARQTNFILALLLIHFVFFGYLSNVYAKNIGEGVLFLYQVLFHPRSFFASIILALIVFLMVCREKFFEYGIRNSIWLVPFIIVQSWIWYWFIIESFDISLIWGYFTRIESYITIFTLLVINILAAILSSVARERYDIFIKRVKKIEV